MKKTTTLTNAYTVDFAARKIIASASFMEKAGQYGSEAYLTVMNLRRDLPDFTVEVLEEKKPAKKKGCLSLDMVRFNYFGVLPDYIAIDRSPEYWVGWSLAYYQWFSNRTFREIAAVVPLSEMRTWYPTLHEADRMRFVEELDRRLMQRPTNLEILRKRANLSQTDLANLSGVSLRSIQMYEQRRNDITKAQFNILNALARVLGCNIYDLMDSDTTLYPSNPPVGNNFSQNPLPIPPGILSDTRWKDIVSKNECLRQLLSLYQHYSHECTQCALPEKNAI